MEQRERSGIIQDLETKDNTLLLILQDEYSKNWQLPTGVIQYVKEDYKKVDRIEIFDVYTHV